MTNYIESIVGDSGKILIEVSESSGGVGFGVQEATTSEEKTHNAFNQALHTIQLAASSVSETLNTLDERPDTARIDFAIKFDAESKAMIAKSPGNAQLNVSLTWTMTKPEGEEE